MKKIISDLRVKFAIQRLLWSHAKLAGVALPPVKVTFSRSSNFAFDAVFKRKASGALELDFAGPYPEMAKRIARGRIGAYLYWFSLCPNDIAEAGFCLDDGDQPSEMMFTPSSRSRKKSAVPDPYFFNNHGFEKMREAASRSNQDWHSRNGDIRWRGGFNGPGRLDFSDGSAQDQTVQARLRMALIGQNIPGFDAGFVGVNERATQSVFKHFGLLKPQIPEVDWLNDKFAIDIDGWTNSWSNFLVRMHLGCCVLKVDSQLGYRQWYYDRIKPWEHFVPVKSDMSDLAEKVDWVRSHDAKAKQIAENGQAFARTMTFESESRVAAEIITNAVRASKNASR